VAPLEFNGREDSIFHEYNLDNRQFMEYVRFHGSYPDIPLEAILDEWTRVYGEQRVRSWIQALEANGGRSWRDFDQEDVVVS
jgi:hypothetical protein